MRTPAKQRHVLMLVQNLPLPFDRRVWLEASTLKDAGYSVSIFCPATSSYPKLRESVEGIDIFRFPLHWEGRSKVGIILEYIWSIFCLFLMTLMISLRRRVHAVHFCNPPDLLFICALPAKALWRSKFIFDQHDLCPEIWETKNRGGGTIIAELLKFFELASYKVSNVVIATNESYKRIAVTRGGKNEAAVVVVRSAPKRDFMNQDSLVARDCSTTLRLVYLGTMGSQEGVELLLDAVHILRNRHAYLQIKLDLIGDGPERRQLEKHSENLGLNAITHFHGRVSDSDLRKLLSFADIAINPDRPGTFNNLSSMNKIVEYMALGVPIVQFYSAEGEFTARAASVYVMEPSPLALADAIDSLRIRQADRQTMKSLCLQRFVEICWETQAEVLKSVYEDLFRDEN